ncbi:MAG: F0F1 ATP synthase subunit A [Planctomycetota bacterium]|nr:F0F1 ATP synthase subunit A [Planctomycetota bacterium]
MLNRVRSGMMLVAGVALGGGLAFAAGEGGPSPVDHVVNHPFPVKHTGEFWAWSGQQGSMVIAALLCVAVLVYAAKRIQTGPQTEGNERYLTKNPLASMIEVICLYLREKVVRPLLHDRTDAFMPFLWTVFFFILFNNLVGLVPLLDLAHLLVPSWKADHIAPVGGTATQNLFVTGTLAAIAALVVNIAGVRSLGIGGYLKHLTAGTPAFLWPLMIPIEIMGTFIKPVALALRLMANMTAGHVLLATLFMFVGLVWKDGTNILLTGSVTLVSFVGAIAIYFLEIFVAFLQAFVFMFLTSVFISQLSHHHDHEHDEGHDHEHAHGHAHAH